MRTTTTSPFVYTLCLLGGLLLVAGVAAKPGTAGTPDNRETEQTAPQELPGPSEELETATFGSGCFWCTEAIFQQLKGVHSVVSGYSGGHVNNPTYEQVMTGTTGHYEVVQIRFDPEVIRYEQLLEVFWRTHDPTNPFGQGADIGPQYLSVIFFHDRQQQRLASQLKTQLNAAKAFGRPVVTRILAYDKFFTAEDYHQNYFERNKRKPYCQQVIAPKLEKFKKVFREHLKD